MDKRYHNGVEVRAIDGWPGNFVGADGRVYSAYGKEWKRSNAATNEIRVERKLSPDHDGRLKVTLTPPVGKLKTFFVHILVATAFHGPCPEGMEASHKNGIRTDNSADNLTWETHVENEARKLGHGTKTFGEKSSFTTISTSQVVAIREIAAMGVSGALIARALRISDAQVSRIIRMKSRALEREAI